ncbi:hypothetical protein C8R45DRAFT_923574 [Mycena sanguinolenta]|nr:hypothetical protein C8R45DRAFT_923574 [Mycena sanguinolenta]
MTPSSVEEIVNWSISGGKSLPSHIKKAVNGAVYIDSRSRKATKVFVAPSQATILKEMIASEQRAEERAQASVTTPVALFINVGLKLQARQYVLQLLLWTDKDQLINGLGVLYEQDRVSQPEDDQTQDSMVEKQCLGADIRKWHQQQQYICPQLNPFVFSEPDKSSEWEKLFLPSDSCASTSNIVRPSDNKDARNNAVCGQAKNTQAVQKIRDVQTKIQNYVKKYQHTHVAMIALGCNPEDPKFGFPELRDEDLYTKNVDQPHNLGDGGKVEGWIWQQGFHGNLTAAEEAEYVLDCQSGYLVHCFNSHHSMAARVQWHRARADMEQWQEVEILGQEFHRAIQGFNKMETIWTALAHDHENAPGKKAYALKVAGMYQQMGKDAQEQFEKVGGTWPKAGPMLAMLWFKLKPPYSTWGKHSTYLKKAGLPVPPPPTPPPGVFERRYPRLRGFPDIGAISLPAEHTLAFKYPDVRLLNQLPAFTGHSPLGWVLFAVIVARRGPGMAYTIKDAAGASVSLRFVESWALENGGGDPTGKDAEQYKNLKPGTVLRLKCVTMSMTAHNEPQVAVEEINLSGVKPRPDVALIAPKGALPRCVYSASRRIAASNVKQKVGKKADTSKPAQQLLIFVPSTTCSAPPMLER